MINLDNAMSLLTWAAQISAVLLGAAAILILSSSAVYFAYKVLTWHTNRLTQRMVNLHGLKRTQEMYRNANPPTEQPR